VLKVTPPQDKLPLTAPYPKIKLSPPESNTYQSQIKITGQPTESNNQALTQDYPTSDIGQERPVRVACEDFEAGTGVKGCFRETDQREDRVGGEIGKGNWVPGDLALLLETLG